MPPSLSDELWQRIIAFIALDSSIPNAWLSAWAPLRQTSSTICANTARIYLRCFLAPRKRCVIEFHCGETVVEEHEWDMRLDMFFHAVHNTDKRRIVFKEGRSTQAPSGQGASIDRKYDEMKYNAWTGRTEDLISGPTDRMPYVISVYGVPMDSALPNLRFDVEEREISFEWEGMLDAFIPECLAVSEKHVGVGSVQSCGI